MWPGCGRGGVHLQTPLTLAPPAFRRLTLLGIGSSRWHWHSRLHPLRRTAHLYPGHQRHFGVHRLNCCEFASLRVCESAKMCLPRVAGGWRAATSDVRDAQSSASPARTSTYQHYQASHRRCPPAAAPVLLASSHRTAGHPHSPLPTAVLTLGGGSKHSS